MINLCSSRKQLNLLRFVLTITPQVLGRRKNMINSETQTCHWKYHYLIWPLLAVSTLFCCCCCKRSCISVCCHQSIFDITNRMPEALSSACRACLIWQMYVQQLHPRKPVFPQPTSAFQQRTELMFKGQLQRQAERKGQPSQTKAKPVKSKFVSNLVFYAQTTGTVISGWNGGFVSTQ